MKKVLSVAFICLTLTSFAQMDDYQFGKGFRYTTKDTSFSIRFGFRFQTLMTNQWTVENDDLKRIEERETNMLIRRSRLKFDGFAFHNKLTYKFELGVANRDISMSDPSYYGWGGNVVLDAYFRYKFYRGFQLQVGQTKLAGNRERVISSANMQLVDRSLLNNAFNLDRDIGFGLIYDNVIGDQFNYHLSATVSQGEGRNITKGNMGGLQYTFRGEVLPFGKFSSKGDYSGSDLVREAKPKLAIGVTYDVNEGAARSRGNLGSFFANTDAMYKDLQTGFIDLMFKYKGFSVMSEYAIRKTHDNNPVLLDRYQNELGVYYTGAALNVQAGYLFKNNYEIAGRFGTVNPQNDIVGKGQTEYILGFSKFISGHSLKVQTDIGYIAQEGKDDKLVWRLQFDFHL